MALLYKYPNAFFQKTDPHVTELAGYNIPPEWWSRVYEYPWALQYMEPGQLAADMGAGWVYRPFKDMLATVAKKVYAVDLGEKLMDTQHLPNVEHIVADFTQDGFMLPERVKRVFCISVLEDLKDPCMVLKQFAQNLNIIGKIVMTFDVRFDDARGTDYYPGLHLPDFLDAVEVNNLRFVGEVNFDKSNAVSHDLYNLCVFHCVLEKVVPEQ